MLLLLIACAQRATLDIVEPARDECGEFFVAGSTPLDVLASPTPEASLQVLATPTEPGLSVDLLDVLRAELELDDPDGSTRRYVFRPNPGVQTIDVQLSVACNAIEEERELWLRVTTTGSVTTHTAQPEPPDDTGDPPPLGPTGDTASATSDTG